MLILFCKGRCQSAVINVYDDTDMVGNEFCGDNIKNPGVRQFLSSNDILYVKLELNNELIFK